MTCQQELELLAEWLGIGRLWRWIKWGKLRTETVATAGHDVPAEIQYLDRFGRVVGYWAYGSFDPSYPYRGQ